MKRIFGIAAAVILVATLVWLAVFNGAPDSPEQTVKQIAQAVKRHDVVAFSHVVNLRNVTDRATDDIRSFVDSNPGLEVQTVFAALGQYIGVNFTSIDELNTSVDIAQRIEAAVRTGKAGPSDGTPAFQGLDKAYKDSTGNADGLVRIELQAPQKEQGAQNQPIEANLAFEKTEKGWQATKITNLPDILPRIAPLPSPDAVDAVKNVILTNVRQYYVESIEEGKIFVIEGLAENKGSTPISHIRLRAVIFNKSEVRVAENTITANGNLGLYQLRVFNRSKQEAELDKADGPMSETLAPENKIPFMFIFYGVPESASEFEIRVVAVNVSQ